MPLITTYDWSGIPGIVVAAPTAQCFDATYAEKVLEQRAGGILIKESYDVTFPWSYQVAERHWEMYKPWWSRF